jgi:hypothetical protein
VPAPLPSGSLPPRTLAALVAVADRLAEAGAEWLLAGSAGRALQGFAVRPEDLDLEVPPRDAGAAAEALGVELRREAGGGRTSARAQTIVARSRIDLTCDLEVEGPGGRLAADFDRQLAWAAPVGVAGRTVLLAPAEETLARALVLGDWEALERLSREAAAGTAGPARPAYLAWRLSSARASAAR